MELLPELDEFLLVAAATCALPGAEAVLDVVRLDDDRELEPVALVWHRLRVDTTPLVQWVPAIRIPMADERLKLDAPPQAVGEARSVEIELVSEPPVRGANNVRQLIPRLNRLVRREDFKVLRQEAGRRPWLGLDLPHEVVQSGSLGRS
jgi:hypothetical protein